MSESIDGLLVVVSTEDIPAGTPLDPLIEHGTCQVVMIASSSAVRGAVTDVEQLQGMCTRAPIYTNEQIPLARLSDIHQVCSPGSR